MRLSARYVPAFAKSVKRFNKKHMDMRPHNAVLELILQNDVQSSEALRNRHNMHVLTGNQAGYKERQIANAGDWLPIWTNDGTSAYFERTGTHEEIFR